MLGRRWGLRHGWSWSAQNHRLTSLLVAFCEDEPLRQRRKPFSAEHEDMLTGVEAKRGAVEPFGDRRPVHRDANGTEVVPRVVLGREHDRRLRSIEVVEALRAIASKDLRACRGRTGMELLSRGGPLAVVKEILTFRVRFDALVFRKVRVRGDVTRTTAPIVTNHRARSRARVISTPSCRRDSPSRSRHTADRSPVPWMSRPALLREGSGDADG